MEQQLVGPPLYSALAEDPDLAGLVSLFVGEMPQRINKLLESLETGDITNLERTAHQLKGAAGSYGFSAISPAAARVEDSIRHSVGEEAIHEAVQSLVTLCRRATAGRP